MFSFRKSKEPQKVASSKASLDDLKKFKPLKDLERKQLLLLEAKNDIHSYEEGHKLIERGSCNNIEYFLLEGSVKKVAKDGKEKFIAAGTKDAINPIAHLQPRQFDVYADTDCKMIEVKWDIIANFFNQNMAKNEPDNQPVYVDLNSPNLQQELVRKFADDVKKGRFTLPSIPEVAKEVSSLIDDPTSSSGQIARAIAMDPAIAVKLVSTANSPLFRGVRQVNSCEEAVTRIGFKTTKQLVQLFAMRELFTAKNTTVKRRFKAHWSVSRQVSAIGYVLAKCVHGLDENEALLGGIVQNIGVIPALIYLDSVPGVFDKQDFDVEHFINSTKNVMGAYMLKEWGWPRDFIEIASNAENWKYKPDQSRVHMTDILITAEAHLNIIQKFLVNCPPLPDIASFNKIAHLLQLTPDKSMDIISAARNEIQAVESTIAFPT